MRVLLVNSPLGRRQRPVFPLGIAYVATVLKDHDVTCYDAAAADNPLQDLSDLVSETRPDLIGVSLRNIDPCTSSDRFSYWPAFVETVKHLKTRSPDARLVVGGSGFNLFAQTVMERVTELDFGIYLEGEESFPELLRHLDNPGSVPGVFYRRDGHVHFSGRRQPVPFDHSPAPRRDMLDLTVYKGLTGVGVQTKRGCTQTCIYCTYPLLTGRKLRLRSPERVCDELEILSRDLGRREIFFSDNVFNDPSSHATAILRGVVERRLDIRWSAYVSEVGLTREFIEVALESGCERLTFAPDGSNDTNLNLLGKAVTRSELDSAYRILEGFPTVKFACTFLWNYPQAGWRDLRDLIRLLLRLVRMENLVGLGLSAMRIFPNTRLHRIAVAEGHIGPEDDLLEPVYHDPFPWNSITALARVLRSIRRAVTAGGRS